MLQVWPSKLTGPIEDVREGKKRILMVDKDFK